MMHTMHRFLLCHQCMERGNSYDTTHNTIERFFQFIFFHSNLSSLQRNVRAKKSSVPNIDICGSVNTIQNGLNENTPQKQYLIRKRSEPDIHYGTNKLSDLVSYKK